MTTEPKPSLRKPFGVIALILFLCVYAALAAMLAEPILSLNALVQFPVWLVLGIAWVPAAIPLVRWIETGRARR